MEIIELKPDKDITIFPTFLIKTRFRNWYLIKREIGDEEDNPREIWELYDDTLVSHASMVTVDSVLRYIINISNSDTISSSKYKRFEPRKVDDINDTVVYSHFERKGKEEDEEG